MQCIKNAHCLPAFTSCDSVVVSQSKQNALKKDDNNFLFLCFVVYTFKNYFKL